MKDRLWRLSHLYKIKTKDRKLKTIRPNIAQMTYLAGETNRDIILKARQLGFSTLKLLEQLDFTIMNKNVNSAVIAHKKEKVQMLFEIIRLGYENLPDLVKPQSSYDNRNEIYFPSMNSKIYVALDTRGETVHNLHVSELAYLEKADEKMLGVLESVPKDGIISFESTANGMSGYFYDIWEDEDSEFNRHFFNWTIDPEYALPTHKTMEELVREYEPLRVQYELIPEIHTKLKLTEEQFAWYITKIRRHRKKVMQEYPSTPTEAFISSGRNVFNLGDLQKHQSSPPVDRKYQDLLIWEQPLHGFKYVIGCDVSEGIGEDDSVIEVFNAHTGNQAAEMAVGFIPPDDLGGFLLDIATYYNKAFIVLEINNHGISVMDRIKKKYLNIYRREVYDRRTQQYKEVLGWQTSLRTKPLLIDALEEATRQEDIIVNSKDLLKEMKTFVRTDEQGKQGFGAEGDKKDDRVIASGLAIWGMRHIPRLKSPKTYAQQKLEEYIEKQKMAEYFPEEKPFYVGRDRRKYEKRF